MGISLDHTAFLGSTVEEIAREKAGIIKEGTPVLWGGEDKSALAVIEKGEVSALRRRNHCGSIGGRLYTIYIVIFQFSSSPLRTGRMVCISQYNRPRTANQDYCPTAGRFVLKSVMPRGIINPEASPIHNILRGDVHGIRCVHIIQKHRTRRRLYP